MRWIFLGALCAIIFWSIYRLLFWAREGWRLAHESGYVTAPGTWVGRVSIYALARVLAFWKVGRIKVIGGEKALAFKGRFIVTPNHTIQHDAIVMARLARLRKWRFMAAMEEVRRFKGLLAPLYAWVGTISVIRQEPRQAANALLGSVKALVRDKDVHFVIFPQGKLIRDGSLAREQFHAGPIKIAQRAKKESGEPYAILPVCIRYDFDRACGRWWERLLGAMHLRSFFGSTVYGATVIVGDPITIESLPTNAEKAVDVLFAALTELKTRAAA